LFVGEDPPRIVAIGRVYPVASMIHIVALHDDFTRLVIEEIWDGKVEVLVPTLEVKLMGETLGTFMA